jgi:hypothetical protein
MPLLMVVVSPANALVPSCPLHLRASLPFRCDRCKSRWCKHLARHGPSDILGHVGDGANRRHGKCSARLYEDRSAAKSFAVLRGRGRYTLWRRSHGEHKLERGAGGQPPPAHQGRASARGLEGRPTPRTSAASLGCCNRVRTICLWHRICWTAWPAMAETGAIGGRRARLPHPVLARPSVSAQMWLTR